jgi:HK97 gp10 family phage protein
MIEFCGMVNISIFALSSLQNIESYIVKWRRNVAQASNVQVIGADEIAKILEEIAPKHARNLMRATIHGVAGEITKESKKLVPIDTGNLKKSLKTKRRRSKPDQPVSDVIATQGKGAKNDGFYWRFVEHGTGGKNPQPARPFIRPSKDKIFAQLPNILNEQFTKKLAAAIKREQKKAAKNV